MIRRLAPLLVTAVLVAVPFSVRAGERDFGPLALLDLAGEKVSLADLHGKVVVLNFWATWCKPCVAEFPSLVKVAERFHDRGVAVIAASVDDAGSRDDVKAFADHLPEGMDIWVGATMDDMKRLGLGNAVPVTVVLDQDGKVTHRALGGIKDRTLDETIENLLQKNPEQSKPFPGVEQACLPGRKSAQRAEVRG